MNFERMKSWLRKFSCDPWLAIVIIVVIVSCGRIYSSFLQQPETLISSFGHDRNAHFLSGLRIAVDIQRFDLWQLCNDFLKLRSWPPLHAVLVGVVSSIVGTDYQSAAITNVIVWGIGACFAYLLAFAAARDYKQAAGFVSLGLYLQSPAHRAFACDFMLETSGCTLTLAALYFFVEFKAAARLTAKPLAIALSGLFFAKYNYWMLVILAIGFVEVIDHRTFLWKCVTNIQWSQLTSWIRSQPRIIANYPLVVLTSIYLTKIVVERLNGVELITSQPKNQNLIHFVFIALLIRVASQWNVEGAKVFRSLATPLRVMCIWHGLPIIIWFALPKRLGYFLWFMGPSNGPNAQGRTFMDSAQFYWQQAAESYHLVPPIFYVAIGLLAVAILSHRCRPSTAIVVFVFLAFSLMLTVNHPNQKSRFIHTWLPSLWVLAGVGASDVLQFLLCVVRFPTGTKWKQLFTAIVFFAIVPWCVSMQDRGRAPESGNPNDVSCLAVADAYLGWIPTDQSIAILGTLPVEYFAEWTYVARFPSRQRPFTAEDMRWFSADVDQNRARFQNWLSEHGPESIVLVDVLENSPFAFPDFENFRQFRTLLSEQPNYVSIKREILDAQKCVVSLWKRKDARQKE